MKLDVKLELTPKTLTNGIRFYGDTDADNEAIEKIRELKALIGETGRELRLVQDKCDLHSNKASAQKIKKEINDLFVEFIEWTLDEEDWEVAKSLFVNK